MCITYIADTRMMFSQVNRRTHPLLQNNGNTIPGVNMNFMNLRVNRVNPTPPPNPAPPTPVAPETKKMIWGEPTWFFFHTITHKVKDESFAIVRHQLLHYIYAVCTNLPCPFCANHAKIYLDSVNFNAIQTKGELKLLIFTFHNEVNKRKQYPLFDIGNLDAKYSSAITIRIFNNFIQHFKDKHRAPGMIADDLFRSKLSAEITIWFRENSYHFEE